MKVVVLSGGVGGARLVSGLADSMDPKKLTVVVNTGDDFYYWGQHISPDIDIVLYHLAGIERENPGWGIRNDSFKVLKELDKSDAEHWFQLGDKDLATSIMRSTLLNRNYSLTEATQALASHFDIHINVFPMTDQYVPTIIYSQDGTEYAFQDYMVKKKCKPTITSVAQKNLRYATIPQGLGEKITEADLIVIGPSNPFVSIATILNINGMKESILSSHAYKLAVSPIIGGNTIKGPASKMMQELGFDASSLTVADFYKDIIDCFVFDFADKYLKNSIYDLGLEPRICDIFMEGKKGRRRLAEYLLQILVANN